MKTLRRIWTAIKEAFTPHWDDDEDPAEAAIMAATIDAPGFAAPIQAAGEKMRKARE